MSRPSARPIRRLALLLLLAACGSRTGLFVDDSFGPLTGDGGTDGGPRRDGGLDGPEEDALPPIDARPPRDADRTDCPDADATLIYVITQDYELFSFDPISGAFSAIGNIVCPAEPNATPFSMAVDRRGVAYVLFTDERLYRVSTATAACVGTPFVPGQLGFRRFGMGFTTDVAGPTERLYVAGSEQSNGAEGLARIDTNTFVLTKVGDFVPRIRNAELTGTGDGRLFGFYTKNLNNDPPTFVGELDPQSGSVVAETRFDGVELGGGWAFAFWGGDFYMFTAPNRASSVVTRYRPADGSVTQVAALPTIVVGAGVSTCAPQQ